MNYSVDEFVDLEKKVWEALRNGDSESDADLLTDDFLGVYDTGFSGKLEHCGQLSDGPVVSTYEILEPRILILSERLVLLSYLASWTKPESNKLEKMYVTSIWKQTASGWKNLFSQDTGITS